MSITESTSLRVNADSSRWRKVGESIVVMDLSNSAYFSVDGSVAHVWADLVGGTTIDSLATKIVEEFDADRDVVVTDLVVLCTELLRRGVLAAAIEDPT